MTIPVDVLDQRFSSLSARLDQALAELRTAIQVEAEAERIYTVAKANAYLAAEGKTAADRQAVTDKIVAAERERAHLATGMTKAAFETVRSLRDQMSNLRVVASAQRALDYARSGWNNQPERSS